VRLCAWRTGWIDGLRPPREHPAVLWGRYFNEFHFILSVRRPFNILYWLYSFELFIYVILFFLLYTTIIQLNYSLKKSV
jgi:hypothetical protein